MSTDKERLRREMKRLRAEAGERALRDGRICEALFALPQFAAARSVFLYNAFGSEAGTAGVAARLRAEGRRVLYPRVCGRDMFLVPDEGQGFAPGAFGIPEPLGAVTDELPQVCVLPLLAADKSFRRLGYGGGFYDRWLARSGGGVFKVGIGYDFQLLDEIPAEAHDVLLDAVVTDARVLLRG